MGHRKFSSDSYGSDSELSTSMSGSARVKVVNESIELFAFLFPIQNAEAQETLVDQIIQSAQYIGQRMTSIRKYSCKLNSLVAIIGALKNISGLNRGKVRSDRIYSLVSKLALDNIGSDDKKLMLASCECLGRIARANGNSSFVNEIIQVLINLVIENREPAVRSGACLALGAVVSFVGGISAGSQLRQCVEVYHSLASDPHPEVHSWALHSLALTIEGSGLIYEPYVNSTLSLVTNLLMEETHEITAPMPNGSNGDSNVTIVPTLGKLLNSLILVMGPELQDSVQTREISFSLFELFKGDNDPFVVAEAINNFQNFILFAPKYIDIPTVTPFLQNQLIFESQKGHSIIRAAAITSIYQLCLRDPGSVLKSATQFRLEAQLFSLLDLETDTATRSTIKDILISLMQYTVPNCPGEWIQLCRAVLLKGGKESQFSPAQSQVEVVDEEQAIPSNTSTVTTILPRWKTQLFAVDCILTLIDLVLKRSFLEDLDLNLARKKQKEIKNADFLVLHLTDLLGLSFNLATGPISFLKLSGLKLMLKIMRVCLINKIFCDIKDPDYPDYKLLEQYEVCDD